MTGAKPSLHPSKLQTERTIDNDNEITMDEIVKALKCMKVGKVAGYDRISSDMLRVSGDIAISLLYQLYNKYWKFNVYLMTRAKPSLSPSIKGKAHDSGLIRRSNNFCGPQEMVTEMNDSIKKRGMKVNVAKTKGSEDMTECHVLIEDITKGECVVCVKGFEKDRRRNTSVRERCGLKEDVVIRIERGMLRWFGQRMNERRLTRLIYGANVFDAKSSLKELEKTTDNAESFFIKTMLAITRRTKQLGFWKVKNRIDKSSRFGTQEFLLMPKREQ
ncbi:hypothetical protein EVAR_68786_1 [Eumeta japonica]|uniref:Uncharacterized protein n=1 Tax=Eumeta variegata TaxID=151549 RepID=A0A4C1ZAC8_EUMVA|nr:hypothetical protein EVAR_68786_1 [Eumeta japonica]